MVSVIPTDEQLAVAAVTDCYEDAVPLADHILRANLNMDDEQHQRLVAGLRAGWRNIYRTRETTSAFHWEARADRLIQENGWGLPKGSKDYGQFLGMLAEAVLDALAVDIERADGNLGADPRSLTVKNGLAAKQVVAASGETIMALFERYAAQRLAEKRKQGDTINQDRKVVEQFSTFVGRVRSVRSLLPKDVRDWRDTVAALPANYRKMKAYAGLSMRDVAAKARTAGAKTISPTTVNRFMSAVSAFLSWCVTNAYADRNPCEGLFYDVPKGKHPRPPFTSEQLATIFSSPLFTGYQRDGKEHKPGSRTCDDWRKWVPLTCLYTGARIGEIAQLRIEDVQSENGIPYLLIRDDESTGQRTKSGYSRPAPIHSEFHALGFIAFVDRQRQRAAGDGSVMLFPELEPNERGQISGIPSRFWRDYLRKIGIKGREGDGYGSHSFRHALADRLRVAGYLDDEIAIALGHSQKTVTSGYGRIRQGTVNRISSMLESITFAEVFSENLPEKKKV